MPAYHVVGDDDAVGRRAGVDPSEGGALRRGQVSPQRPPHAAASPARRRGTDVTGDRVLSETKKLSKKMAFYSFVILKLHHQ